MGICKVNKVMNYKKKKNMFIMKNMMYKWEKLKYDVLKQNIKIKIVQWFF